LYCKTFYQNLKAFIDKILREIPGLKQMIKSNTIEAKILETMNCLTDSLVQFVDQYVFDILKKNVLDEDWLNAPDAATVSFSIKELTFYLYFFKTEIYDLLDEERKGFGKN